LADVTPHTISPAPFKMLVVRAVDDEASLALAAGAIANRLSTLTGWGIAYVMMVLVAGLRVAGFNSDALLAGWRSATSVSLQQSL